MWLQLDDTDRIVKLGSASNMHHYRRTVCGSCRSWRHTQNVVHQSSLAQNVAQLSSLDFYFLCRVIMWCNELGGDRISERSAGRINLESQLILSVNTDHGRLELQLYSTGTIRRPADSSRNCWTGHAGSLLSHVKPAGVLDAGWLQFCCLANSCQLIKRILFSWNVLEKPHISIVTDTIILSIVS
jgi:hypothetical protein